MGPSISKKLAASFLITVLLYFSGEANEIRPCCKDRSCSCRLHDLLLGVGNHGAGILTLGKRKAGQPNFRSHLYRLLHGSRDQSEGILTLGKRYSMVPEKWSWWPRVTVKDSEHLNLSSQSVTKKTAVRPTCYAQLQKHCPVKNGL
uniref:Hypocretin neuropeptide precursor n=1 Tax=Paramormyrops kingsleyae TaxID=1676925 RepID=A0A3B3R8F2_9TELE